MMPQRLTQIHLNPSRMASERFSLFVLGQILTPEDMWNSRILSPQDFTLFVIMKQKNIKVWKEKLDWIAEKGGMVLLNTHPDYMDFKGKGVRVDEYPAKYYMEFLEYVKSEYEGQYWHVLPKDMAKFWSKNLSMMIPFRQD